jgi:hypothetical protein
MPPTGFELVTPESERSHTHALDYVATGASQHDVYVFLKICRKQRWPFGLRDGETVPIAMNVHKI